MADPDSYRTIDAAAEAELEIKRSRFRCVLAPVADEEAAREAVALARRQHWDARHHCSAFVLGPGGAVERSSDDGEPSGTAGAPILEALRASGLTDLVAVVTRWFGGTLLGTGGLVRAYGGAVRLAIDSAQIREVRLVQLLTATVDAATAGRVEAELRAHGIMVVETTWGQQVDLLLGVRPAEQPTLDALLAELTGGSARARPSGEQWL
ncbi:IMPACT family protein [Pseudactinotalea sp.]|uniref:IMPACT family protein n=1 Tax=Pseudactinotalea sp. TaxID=1926260 RepID=UPI003B3B07A1